MSNLTTRAGKGSPLTNNELDANFTNLNSDKVEIGGDLSGTSSAPNVAKIQGRAVSADAPAVGEKLVWNGAAWEPSADPVPDHGNLSGLGDDDHAQYLHVSEVRSPSSAVKNSFLPTQAGQSGKYLTTDGSSPSWGAIPSGSLSFTGDVTGSGTTGSSTTLTLSNSGATAGTYSKVTVDAKGRVTTGALISNADVTTALGFTPENSGNKGVANGYASLDGSGKVPSTQLPSYVDDVLEYANLAALPGTGESGKIYITIDTAKTYRWSGSAYVEISASPGSTDAVPEGSTNLYFTNSRARGAITATGSLSYNNSTGVLSYTQPTNVSTFTNDSGYITSSASISGSADSVRWFGRISGETGRSTHSSGVYNYSTFTAANNGGNPPTTYAEVLAWGGGSAGTIQIAGDWISTTSTPLYVRSLRDCCQNWSSWTQILTSTTYNSYSPTLTGTGASGTWGINITGNAATATSATDSTKLPLSGGLLTGSVGHVRGTHRYFERSSGVNVGAMGWHTDDYFYVAGHPSFGPGAGNSVRIYGFGNDLLLGNQTHGDVLRITGGTVTIVPNQSWNAGNGGLNIGGTGDARLQVRHIWGKDSVSAGVDHLWLNYANDGKHVQVGNSGGGNNLYVAGNIYTNGYFGGNLVLNAGNYTSFNGTLRALGDQSGMNFNTSSFNSMYYAYIENSANKPTSYSYPYGTILTFDPGIGNGGRAQFYISHAGNDLTFRGGWNNNDSWQTWNRVLTNQNYTSYSPSLTGSGASGTWGINITGNAASASNLVSGGGVGRMEFGSGGGGASFGSNHYAMGKDVANGGWSHPHYSDLIIGYHTGIRLGAAYSGIRFYDNSPTTDANNDGNGDQGEALLMTIGGHAAGSGVIINNTLSAGNVLVGGNQSLHAGNWGNYIQTTYAGWDNYPGKDANTVVGGSWARSYFTYSNNAPLTGALAHFPAGGYDLQFNGSYHDGNGRLAFRNRNGDNGTFLSWREILHAGNFGSYALPLSGGTVTGQATFSKTDDHAISVGTIRGRAVGGQGGEFLHIYERVHIGSPVGWGSRSAPTYGLSTYGGCALATDTGSVTISGHTALHAGNFGSYALPLSGGTMSGRLTISPGWTTSGRNYSNEWIEFGNHSGLYSPHNNAHFYPNNNIFGSWRIAGSRNGWAGLEFDASNGQMSLMVNPNSNVSGVHNNSYGWQFRWENGTFFCHKNSYGGGTAATVLDSSNYTSYSPSLGGSGASGTWGISITGNAATVGGYAVGTSTNQIPYLNSSRNLSISSPENYSGEVRLGAAWDRGGVYAQNTLTLATSASEIHFVFGNVVRAWINSSSQINAPGGYISNGNPWGTSNSAFFPNGITTPSTTNWIYGHCYLGNAPSNGSGAQVEPNGRFHSVVANGTAMQVIRSGSGGTATNSYTALFEQTHGNHSWGIVSEFRVGASGGSDRPSILFSSGFNSDTWTVGFGYVDSNFRINRDHGHRNGSWGTTLMIMDRSGNVTFSGNVTAYSDRRLKTDIKRIENAGDIVRRLEGVSFKYRENGQAGIGLIAQDVELVLPQIVGEATSSDGSTHKNLAYGNVVAVLIEAIKELQIEVAALKSTLH